MSTTADLGAAERPAIVDTHCHLDVADFDADRDRVLTGARAAGVVGILVPAIHAAGWPGLLAICAAAPDLHPALGLHPVYLAEHRRSHLADLERLLAEHPISAIGEIGLDYFVPDLDPAAQRAVFEAQLAIAATASLPVIVHARKSHDDVLRILERHRLHGGIAHAFSGSIQQAHRYLGLGFRLGFGGMLTFARSRRLRTLARELPPEAIVLETDAPDLTVAAHQGERNSPEYLPDVLAALAEVRDQDPREVAARTTRNALDVLRLTPDGEPPTVANRRANSPRVGRS